MFAVIKTGGKQVRVEPGDKIKIEKLPQKEGEKVSFDHVLLFADGEKLEIGQPFLNMLVNAKILKHGQNEKINVVKFKAKKRYKRTKNHRQEYSEVEILDISEKGSAKKEEAEKPAKKIVTGNEAVKKSSIKAPAKKASTKKKED